ncbi:facilitated trehalose transporter Tret1-like [Chrysoperla carnea]|uniref:facilitated trehalose transporter Tret1-like n=1 Tax=Chrysoperla carnea TaxID=189513 RepID=UPI001D061CD7|nr:facilitated trehalose transporter Tret1-like [Chrysoperla carnea]
MFITGMHFVWSSPSLPKLYANESQIHISIEEGSWIASTELLTNIPGSLIGAILADYLGRKKSILITTLPYLSSWLLIAYGKDIKTLLTAKFLVGIADGITYTILPMYVGEIAEDDIRGKLGNCMTVMFDSGSLFLYSVAPWISIQSMAQIGSIFPIILCILIIFMPETPYYLLMKEKIPEAKESLQLLRQYSSNIDTEFNEMRKIVEFQTHQTSNWSDLYMNPGYFKGILIIMGVKTLQQMSGIYAIMVYSEIIFEEADGIFSGAISSIIFGTFLLISGICGLLIIDKIGRRPLLVFSFLGCFLALITQTIYFYFQYYNLCDLSMASWVPISAMLVYIISYGIGLGPIPMTYIGEMFPTNIKAKALCFLDIYFGLIEFIVVKNYQIMANYFGSYIPFAIFSMSCLIGIPFVLYCIPETKGCSLDYIQNILGNNNISNEKNTKHVEITKL